MLYILLKGTTVREKAGGKWGSSICFAEQIFNTVITGIKWKPKKITNWTAHFHVYFFCFLVQHTSQQIPEFLLSERCVKWAVLLRSVYFASRPSLFFSVDCLLYWKHYRIASLKHIPDVRHIFMLCCVRGIHQQFSTALPYGEGKMRYIPIMGHSLLKITLRDVIQNTNSDCFPPSKCFLLFSMSIRNLPPAVKQPVHMSLYTGQSVHLCVTNSMAWL